mmetsp:Transcript_41089/g.90178  ORF Transcript_41089/g.90178 Transcript_41089/m.90178 type:complete len:259 (-) Transcript_41089:2876-3652(-)
MAPRLMMRSWFSCRVLRLASAQAACSCSVTLSLGSTSMSGAISETLSSSVSSGSRSLMQTVRLTAATSASRLSASLGDRSSASVASSAPLLSTNDTQPWLCVKLTRKRPISKRTCSSSWLHSRMIGAKAPFLIMMSRFSSLTARLASARSVWMSVPSSFSSITFAMSTSSAPTRPMSALAGRCTARLAMQKSACIRTCDEFDFMRPSMTLTMPACSIIIALLGREARLASAHAASSCVCASELSAKVTSSESAPPSTM